MALNRMNPQESLIIFYDGLCPLCVTEMRSLKKHDSNHRIRLIDIRQDSIEDQFPEISRDKALNVLHGMTADKVITGLDVTCLAWKLVNKHKWIAILRWPGIKLFADIAYRLFARYRFPISKLLLSKGCKDGRCEL
jgi:predicted DCC family thiol-disulfide oxidoreductase YuxK